MFAIYAVGKYHFLLRCKCLIIKVEKIWRGAICYFLLLLRVICYCCFLNYLLLLKIFVLVKDICCYFVGYLLFKLLLLLVRVFFNWYQAYLLFEVVCYCWDRGYLLWIFAVVFWVICCYMSGMAKVWPTKLFLRPFSLVGLKIFVKGTP